LTHPTHPKLPRLRGKATRHVIVFVLFLLGLLCFAAGLAIVVYDFSFVEWRTYEFLTFILGSSCMEFIAKFLIVAGFVWMYFALEPGKLFSEKEMNKNKEIS
jgi:hypothetical protein